MLVYVKTCYCNSSYVLFVHFIIVALASGLLVSSYTLLEEVYSLGYYDDTRVILLLVLYLKLE